MTNHAPVLTRFTLPDAALRGPLVVFPSWISNGDWAVRRSRLTNARVFEGTKRSDHTLRACLQGERLWCGTPELIRCPCGKSCGRVRVFVGEDGSRIGFRKRYLALFGLDTPDARLYGGLPGGFRNAQHPSKATVVLMPVVLDMPDGAQENGGRG